MNAGRAIDARQHRIVESATDLSIITTDLSGQVIGWCSGAELLLGHP
jgi:hypothetical protein